MRIFLLVTALLLLPGCSHYLFVPTRAFPVTPENVDLSYRDLQLQVAEGVRLHGWQIKARAGSEYRGSILFFHGNGDNVSTQLPNTFWLSNEGYDVYVFDYRGYGRSQGRPDLDATIGDMEKMIAVTLAEMTDPQEKLIIMGHSLGGAMAVHVVAHSRYRDRIKTLITVEAFSDYHQIAQEVMAKSWLLWLFQWPLKFAISNEYSPLLAAPAVSPVPLLILHSENDEMIGMHHAKALFLAAQAPKSLRLIDSGHNNVFAKKENRQVLLRYLDEL